ncbi:MAG: ABC transporter ATP-binding protein [Fimbriimonadaceae bacterium]
MKPAIEIHDLHKHFDLSHSGAASIKTALLWFRRRRIERLEVLRGITFNLNQGETVALVGRNGAGKSTLLSLIARVYKPSSGTINVNGRVAPLLELGAGFHPDLTGLENIQFNGVILGLTRKELAKRVDRIVEFAELENHIDTPVRTYSSGMMARLGFAIAAHVDADIMIVDEVLAVGDFAFEEKCYQKIEEFRANGGSILFVSHNFDSIYRVADRCLWMREGVVAMEGDPREVVAAYREEGP